MNYLSSTTAHYTGRGFVRMPCIPSLGANLCCSGKQSQGEARLDGIGLGKSTQILEAPRQNIKRKECG